MKKFTTYLTAIVLAIAMITPASASAQFKWGPKVGVNVSSMHLNKSVFDSSNRTGFTGGLTMELTVPLIGIGLDASVMYVKSKTEFTSQSSSDSQDYNSLEKATSREYISVPVHLKYKLQLPAISKIITPFAVTGPDFSFLTSKRSIENAVKNRSVDVSWDFGAGIELLQHLQVSASYSIGITKAFEVAKIVNGTPIEGKNRAWTITAAYLF